MERQLKALVCSIMGLFLCGFVITQMFLPWSQIWAPLFCELMWMKCSVICWSEKHFFSLSRNKIAGVSVCQGESEMNEPLAPYQ